MKETLNLVEISNLESWQNEKIKSFYLGVDPTGNSLHIGHLIPLHLAKKLIKKGFLDTYTYF